MKVIVIDEWFPWPLESGKKIRTYNLITRLAKEYEIIYLAYANLSIEQEKATELERRGIKTIAVNDCRIKKWTIPFYLSVIMNFFSSKPYSTYYHIKKDFISKLKETIEQENPQLIHCEWTNLAPFLEYVDKIPTVITAHNIESDIWYRLASSGGNIFSRMVGRNQAHKIEKLERQWYPKVNLCIAVSDEDKKIIESYGASASIVENGVDVNYYSQIVSEAEDYSIAFTASFDTFSNQDGAYYFIEEIYPLIKQKQPHAKLKLIGKSPPERFWKYAQDDSSIFVSGTIPDIRTELSRALVSIVPLRIGGGTRLKILEALAMKKPVVSTSIGAEGLKVSNGSNILLADTPEDFALAVLKCLSDRHLRSILAENGWKLVNTQYDWSFLAHKQSQLWHSIINNF